MTLAQRKILALARRRADEIPETSGRQAKGRAVRRLCHALRWLIAMARHEART